METSECIHIYKHSSDVLSVDISSDGNLLVAGCLAGNVKVRCPTLQFSQIGCSGRSP